MIRFLHTAFLFKYVCVYVCTFISNLLRKILLTYASVIMPNSSKKEEEEISNRHTRNLTDEMDR